MENQDVNTNNKYLKAKEKVAAIKGFYGNLLAYCIVISILAFINYNTTSFAWFLFPALGWGFGLLMHGLSVYEYNPFFGKDWEERKIKEFMQNS
jgi:hypothetical protein